MMRRLGTPHVRRRLLSGALLLCVMCLAQTPSAQLPGRFPETDFNILAFIHNTWQTLSRSTLDCTSLEDPKLAGGNAPVVYYPAEVAPPDKLVKLQSRCRFELRSLPRRIERLGALSPASLKEQGLLYLPNPYVVPGGRFNEMYGWDSYFIIRGLLEDGQTELARGMVENFFFQIEHYGAVLNANRTYYLTRSQPPFLSSMIIIVHEAEQRAGNDDRPWLKRAYRFAQRDYALWTGGEKLDRTTGLSRYYDFGSGPVPEIGDDVDYYLTVADWFSKHPESNFGYLLSKSKDSIGPELRVPLCGKVPCEGSTPQWLSTEFYHGDRALRESGFDITFRFGPFGAATHHFAPVCLNSLLYKEERDLATMARELNHPAEARVWEAKAAIRKQRVNRYLWDAKQGLYVDYNLQTRTRSDVLYATIFYPLWTGMATQQQAEAVIAHLPKLEFPGGLATSTTVTGVQWDKPYGWAPLQLIAFEGMRRYGHRVEADRLATEFLSMVAENARRDGTIREKYNVVDRSAAGAISAGYSMNAIGFGWTNGVFVSMLHQLSPETQGAILLGQKAAHAAAPNN